MIDEKAVNFLREYVNTPSPSGMEKNGQQVWLDYIKPYVDDWQQDSYNNTIAVINPGADIKVLIEAHADEISWLVNYIDDNGFIRVIKNGGEDTEVAPGNHVLIHTSKGAVEGVFGWPAIHVRKDIKDLNADIKHLFVDCGTFSKKETEALGIQIGDTITFKNGFNILHNDFFVGRGLDNKVGGLVIAEVARSLKENKIKLPYSLYIANAVQEEVGSHGAEMISGSLSPDMAIVIDATHDTQTPFIHKERHGDTACGKGPIISIAPAANHRLLQHIIETAEKEGIPYQRVAVSRNTGTDTETIAIAKGGTVSALISIPLRYMHTPVEMVYKKDVENIIRLYCAILEKIDPEELDIRRIKA